MRFKGVLVLYKFGVEPLSTLSWMVALIRELVSGDHAILFHCKLYLSKLPFMLARNEDFSDEQG
jgi:hypothetical protein